jgi:hypothetical protein
MLDLYNALNSSPVLVLNTPLVEARVIQAG